MKYRYLAITETYERYEGHSQSYKFFYGKDDEEAVLHMHRQDFDGDVHNEEEVDEFIDEMETENGDGKDHITIINLRTEKVVFGGN